MTFPIFPDYFCIPQPLTARNRMPLQCIRPDMLDYESPSKHRPPLSVLKLPNDSPHKRFIAGMLHTFEQYTGYKLRTN